MSQAAHTRRGDGRRFGDPEKKGGLYVIRIPFQRGGQGAAALSYDAPWPAESECAHGAFPLLGIKI
jgi:hypothetical protein